MTLEHWFLEGQLGGQLIAGISTASPLPGPGVRVPWPQWGLLHILACRACADPSCPHLPGSPRQPYPAFSTCINYFEVPWTEPAGQWQSMRLPISLQSLPPAQNQVREAEHIPISRL